MRTQRTVGAALSMMLGLAASLSVTPAYAEDQASKSAAVAKELSQRLDQAKLQHIAARDPEDPNRFIAAMYFPGMQIVTVSGKYSVPVLLNEKLMAQEVSGHLRRPEQRLRARQPHHHRRPAV